MHVNDSEGRSGFIFTDEIPVNPIEIILNEMPGYLKNGETFQLTPELSSKKAETFTFSSSDTAVLTVDDKGLITAVGTGKAEITVTGTASGISKKINLSVAPADAAELKVKLGAPSYSMTSSPYGTAIKLSFAAEVEGGVKPYTCSYELLRDNTSIYTTEGTADGFAVTGAGLASNGFYTARCTVTDSVGQVVTVNSQGYFYKNGGTTLVGSFAKTTADFVIPAGTVNIEESAFEGTKAGKIDVPESCTSIASRAFANCTSLKQITIPKNCSIEDDAFQGCGFFVIYGKAGSPAEEYAKKHSSQCYFVGE